MKTKADIMRLVEQEDVEFIRLQFTDMFGNLKNTAITANQLERVLDHNYVFDGSFMFGNYRIGEEDLYLKPDLDSFMILPWRPQQGKVARFLCDVCKADGSVYEMSSRTILKKVLADAKEQGYTCYIDPECEFFLFHTDENGMPTTITHEQAGYMDVGPMDLGENARRDIVLSLEDMGFEIESSHHEMAPGQHEIDFKEGEALHMADSIVTFKSAVRSVAKRFGLHATFMPKPKQGVAGSGMHLNISVYKNDRNIFRTSSENNELSDETKWFIGGVLDHAKVLCGVCNPLVNSYKRLVSGFDAPGDLTWSTKNRNTLVKVRQRPGEDMKLELRFPDPSANPYLAIAVCIAAGLDGIAKHTEPGAAMDENHAAANQVSIHKKQNGDDAEKLPGTLREAIACMRQDEWIGTVLGEEFTQVYTTAKTAEWEDYVNQVSDWEIKAYLNRI